MTSDNRRDVARAWEPMKRIGFAVPATRDGGKLRARSMVAT